MVLAELLVLKKKQLMDCDLFILSDGWIQSNLLTSCFFGQVI